MKDQKITSSIDDVLPQTQCGLCDYPGCKPYANAIAEQGEHIDRCLPGGVDTLKKLAQITQQDPSPMIEAMRGKQKAAALVTIREPECIGCTKCIQACPVDAIVGAAKVMHTVIADACTGCELCIPVCPVDCIDLVEIAQRDPEQQHIFATQSRQRYQQRNQRLEQLRQQQSQAHQSAKLQQQKTKDTISVRQQAIAAAVARAKAKKTKGIKY